MYILVHVNMYNQIHTCTYRPIFIIKFTKGTQEKQLVEDQNPM